MKRQWDNFFQAEDAEPSDVIYRAKVISLDKANEILRQAIEAAPEVNGSNHGVNVPIPYLWTFHKAARDSHTAKLICIKPIEGK